MFSPFYKGGERGIINFHLSKVGVFPKPYNCGGNNFPKKTPLP
jgi:hypothetical protein